MKIIIFQNKGLTFKDLDILSIIYVVGSYMCALIDARILSSALILLADQYNCNVNAFKKTKLPGNIDLL